MKKKLTPKQMPVVEKEQTDPRINALKLEYVRWFVVLLLSIMAFWIFAKLIVAYYQPDINALIENACKISVAHPLVFKPEPVEKLLFSSSVLIFSFSLLAFYFLADRYIRNTQEKVVQGMYILTLTCSIIGILYLIIAGLKAANPFYTSDPAMMMSWHDQLTLTNKDFYFIGTFMYEYFYLYLCLIFPVIVSYFVYYGRFAASPVFQYINKFKAYLVYGFCMIIIICIFFAGVFKFPYTPENKIDFNAIYYSIVQVYHGDPLLIDHFTNTYGLYPHFILPLIKLFGLSVLTVSSIMAFLQSVCFLCLLFFLGRMVKSKALILLGFTSVFFNAFLFNRIITYNDPYFAMYPIRWILPCLLLVYASLYTQHKSRLLYFSSFFFFATGVLWNLEFGILAYISLIAFYSYLELGQKKITTIITRIATHIIVAAASIFITFNAYTLIIKLIYGQSPDFSIIFSTLNVFSVCGLNMLPMPHTFHPWMILALILLCGLLYAIKHFVNHTTSHRSAIVFMLTVLGVGTFAYYQGRSHNWGINGISPMPFLILTILADDIIAVVRKHKMMIGILAMMLFVLSFSFFQTIYSYNDIVRIMFDREDKIQYQKDQNAIESNARFIDQMSKDNERVMLCTFDAYQGLLHGLSNTASAFNPGWIDIFYKDDHERMKTFLKKNQTTKIFFEPERFHFSIDVPDILSAFYDITAIGDPYRTMWMLERKKDAQQKEYILKQEPSLEVLHEVFDIDRENLLAYAQGEKGPITLGQQFTIELIFRPTQLPVSNITKWITLFTNRKGLNGIKFQQDEILQNQYCFYATSDIGLVCPVKPNEWNYVLLEVNDKTVSCFTNGAFAGSLKTNKTYTNSDLPLYIGTYNNKAGLFWGDIKEIKITNKLFNNLEVDESWEAVQKFAQHHGS